MEKNKLNKANWEAKRMTGISAKGGYNYPVSEVICIGGLKKFTWSNTTFMPLNT